MNQINYAGNTLFSVLQPYLSRHTSKTSILISSFLAILGIVSIWIGLDLNVSSVTMGMTLLTIGTTLLLVALYRAFWKSREIVYNLTGSTIIEGTRYMDTCNLQALLRTLEQKTFEQLSDLSLKSSGNIRLDYMLSKDGQFAAIQLFRFLPYMYEPVSQVYCYIGNDAVYFTRHFKNKNF